MLVSWSFIQKGMSVSYIKSLQFVIISFINTGNVTHAQTCSTRTSRRRMASAAGAGSQTMCAQDVA